MNVADVDLPGAKLITPNAFCDARGFFLETFQKRRYAELGIDVEFVQDNHSRSVQGTLRGLHYQADPGQAKLVSVSRGQIYTALVDIRPNSPTFGRHFACLLDDERHQQLFIPVGLAHGFCVLSPVADVCYKASSPYNAATECALSFNDSHLAIPWPIANPLVSERDRNAESFASYRSRMSL